MGECAATTPCLPGEQRTAVTLYFFLTSFRPLRNASWLSARNTPRLAKNVPGFTGRPTVSGNLWKFRCAFSACRDPFFRRKKRIFPWRSGGRSLPKIRAGNDIRRLPRRGKTKANGVLFSRQNLLFETHKAAPFQGILLQDCLLSLFLQEPLYKVSS